MAKRDLALDLFRSFQNGSANKRSSRKKSEKERNQNSLPNSDPHLFKNVLSDLIMERDWKTGIAEGTLFSTWPNIVGEEIALHSTPLSLLDGVLTLQTSSTAWATQLRLVAPELLLRIQNTAPGALVESISLIGPQGPTWKKGLRTIRGARGPRDTYG